MKKISSILLIATLLVSSCATTPSSHMSGTPPTKPASIKDWMAIQSRAKKKALVGALIGAAIGAATAGALGDDPWRGAAAGALAGAIAGFGVGKAQDRMYAERDEAVRQTNYDRAQGYVARVDEVTFAPPHPKPGETATLYIRYVVVGPDPSEAIRIRVFRGLKFGDDYVFGAGPNDFVIRNGGGVVESKMAVTFAKTTPEGTYSVEALLEDPRGRFPQAVGTGALSIVASAHDRRQPVLLAVR